MPKPMFPTPRQGFLFTVPIKNPWGEATDTGIDISPLVYAVPGVWHQVVEACNGSPYLDGSFVYVPRGAGESVVMADRTLQLIHESVIKASLLRDAFKPEYESVSTTEYMERLRERIERQNRPAITVPANGRQLEV